jgi:hypothetical protein
LGIPSLLLHPGTNTRHPIASKQPAAAAVRGIKFRGRLVNLGGRFGEPIVIFKPQITKSIFIMILYPPVAGYCG